MGFFSKNETRNIDITKQDMELFLDVIQTDDWNEIQFTGADALKNADVLTALKMIASDIAGLKVTTADRANNSDLLSLLNIKPNEVMSGYSLKYAIVSNLILDGNVFVEITRNEKGRAIQLDLIPNSRVTIKTVKDVAHTKLVSYEVTNNNDTGKRVVESKDMLHFKMLSTDGIVGQSPLRALHSDLRTDKNSKAFLNNFFANGTHAGGIIKVNESISSEAKEKIKQAWQKANAGVKSSSQVVVLDESMEYSALQIDTELIKLINSNTSSKTVVAQTLGIPLHKMGLSTSNMDLSQLNQDYLISTLKSYLDIIIAELYKLDNQMLIEFDFNTDAYKNIDTKQIHENIKIERELGLISVDEARIKLGYEPLNNDIGKQHITNLNFVNSDIANEYQLNKVVDKGGDTVNE